MACNWTAVDFARAGGEGAFGGTKGIALGQAFLAFGLCRGALELMGMERFGAGEILVARFGEQLAECAECLEVCRSGQESDAGPQLRAACNDLALRITQSLVALQKGSGLMLDHPAQRLRRGDVFSGLVVQRSGDRLHGGL